MMRTEAVEQKRLELPLAEVHRLAERLIASLDQEATIQDVWMREVRRRAGELVSGAVEAIALDVALPSIRTRFGW